MNRIALRLSLGLLITAVALIITVPLVARWHFSLTIDWHGRLHEQLVSASALPEQDRERALQEVARSFSVPVEIINAADVKGPPGLPPPSPWGGPGPGNAARPFGPPMPPLAGPPGGMPGPAPFNGMVVVRIPGTEQAIQAGPIRPPLWPFAGILLGVIALVTITGSLLARPLVRRLTRLQETAMRIAKGEISARADTQGNDAISDFAAHFNRMAERNQALLEGQRDLMRGVSHELRTPVARIRFALELARETQIETERERHFGAIDSDLGEIDELIQELLLVDRLSDGSAPMPAQPFVALTVVLDEIRRQGATRPQIEMVLQKGVDGHMNMVGSERLFRRVVRNLLSNALRHAQSIVRVSIAGTGDEVIIGIEDDGPGIPASERARILEPFVRLDESRSRESGGVGLGLTIVDRILRAVGGSLRIEEGSSGGARVEIAWPNEASAQSVSVTAETADTVH